MATKVVLEQQISELQTMLEQARQEAKEYKDKYHQGADTMEQTIEDAIYEKFKASNGKMLSRFIKEYISENLSVEVVGKDSNYIEVNVLLDGEVITTDSDSI